MPATIREKLGLILAGYADARATGAFGVEPVASEFTEAVGNLQHDLFTQGNYTVTVEEDV